MKINGVRREAKGGQENDGEDGDGRRMILKTFLFSFLFEPVNQRSAEGALIVKHGTTDSLPNAAEFCRVLWREANYAT